MLWLGNLEAAGFLPGFLSSEDSRPAREQFDASYQHGGGWRPIPGFTATDDFVLRYPGDPPFLPMCATRLRNEVVVVYPHAFVAIFQADGSFEVARMD